MAPDDFVEVDEDRMAPDDFVEVDESSVTRR